MSDYLRSSRALDLLEAVSPDLAFAGIATNLSSSPNDTWSDLEAALQAALRVIGAGVHVAR
jgi:hypothetical protein